MEIKQIKTTLPFTDDELDMYFDNIEEYYFHVDLDKSQYRGKQLLTYIYNSGMKANIESNQFSGRLDEILLEYIKTSKIIDIQSLNDIWLDVLMWKVEKKSYENTTSSKYQAFICNFCQKHHDVVEELLAVFSELKGFLLKVAVGDEEAFPDAEDCAKSFKKIGENIVSLRHGICFWKFIGTITDTEKGLCKEFVTDSFDGKKIAYFFFSEFNPLSLLYMARDISNKSKEGLKL